ncbi:MAG TPA: HD domain-containing phosphohydrolase [Acidimicrobiales bacterium]
MLSTVIFLAPIAVSVGVASIVATSLPHPVGVTRTIFWWAAVLGASTLALYGTERAARRFLPLAALLKMTMLFPDKAPSRLGVALRSGTTKDLERRLDVGQLAAEEPTEAAAEILALAGALSAHDRQTRGHSERVRAITDMIAEELELSSADRDRLRWSALLHDIGKLTVHAEVLNKTEKLSAADWEELKSHPLEGARLIAPLSSWLGEWSLTVAQHHEKHDGTGYPYGLAGEEISLGARIVAVADSFEVMTAARAYKRPASPSWARQELTRCAGTQFDPVIVRAFLNISIGRLRRAIGPISWLVDAPVVSQLEHLGQAASVGSRTALMATAIGASALAANALPASEATTNSVSAAQVPALSRVAHLAVAKGSQNITFTSTSSGSDVGETYLPRATGGASGNAVVFSIPARTASTCSISGSAVSFLSSGTCIIDANQSGNTLYETAPQSEQTVIVRAGDPTVDVVSNAVVAGGTLVFTASVSGPTAAPRPTGSVTWQVRSPDGAASTCSSVAVGGDGSTATYTCSIDDVGAGTYSAVATYGGDGNYHSGSSSNADATVDIEVITQSAPTTGSVSTTKSASFTDQLATSGQNGAVHVVTTSADAHMSVSSSGVVTTSGTLAAGSYAVSGTDSNASGATGTWSYALTVTAVAIDQGSPTTGSVSTTKSASFTDQLATSGQNGTVSFVTTSANGHLTISSSGVITTSGTLAAGSYAVSGTDSDADGDSGTWSYTLAVAAGAIGQGSPDTGRVSTTKSASFTDQLATSGQNGAVSFVTTMPNSDMSVSSSGEVTTTGTLAAGTFTVSGTDSDAYGDSGTWSYTLKIDAVAIGQDTPTTGSVSTTDSAGFSDQLATSGQNGAESFVTTSPNLSVAVSSSGVITTTGLMATASYNVTGTDSDAYGDSGTWTYTLTVSAVAIGQSGPTTGNATTTNSAGFTDQLATSGQNGAVSFLTTSTNAGVSVSSSGAITTTGTLAAGSYTASGNDSDAYGDSGTWSYTLTVSAVAIGQSAPTTGNATTTNSAGFTDQLATSGQNGAVSFVTTSANTHLNISSSGAITTSGTLVAGSYTVSGTDSDAYSDTGTWSYTLTVSAVAIGQSAPTTGNVTTTNSAGFTDQLATSGQNGAVSFVTTSANAYLVVSSAGAITTAGGILAAGSYTVSGTDGDAYGDSGTWTYTLTVSAVAIGQSAPTTRTATTTNSAGFTDQLATSGQNGAVTFVTTSANAHLVVSSSGAITTAGTLAAGTYPVSGTDSDAYGDSGAWTYTLTVQAVVISQGAPTTGTVSTTNSTGFTAQLATTGQNGSVTSITTSPNAHLVVSPSGAITTAGGILDAGSYTVSGTDSDAYGDSGTWSYTLTVSAVAIGQGAPTTGSVSTTNSAGFTVQLATSGQNGAASFVTTSPNSHLLVSAAGAVTTAGGLLDAGTYTVSGTDSDAYGDSGTWSYTLTVTAVAISQSAPYGASQSWGLFWQLFSPNFTSQLVTSGQNGSVTFVTTSPNANLAVSSSGAITTTGVLGQGSYTVSGTDSDAYGDTGTWSFTLTVSFITIDQDAPTTGSVSTTNSGAFTAQLATNDPNGAATFVTTAPNAHLHVSSSGAIATTGILAAGTYTVSGSDSDAYNGTGTWSYTLTVTAVAIGQDAPITGSVSTTNSAGFIAQLATNDSTGAVSYVTTVSNTHLSVSSSGAIATTGALAAGSYTVSGTDSDAYGDTGTWSYTLTVTAVAIAQDAPTAGSVSTTNSAGFTDQIATSGQNGPVSFVTTLPNASLGVSSSGAIATTGALAAGSYTVSGTDGDPYGDTGTWSYTLTVHGPAIDQGAPTTGTVSTTGSAAFTAQLATDDPETVTFVRLTSNAYLNVSSSGVVTTTGTLPAGNYAVSGTDSDTSLEVGTWSFTLTVSAVSVTQDVPTSNTVSAASSATFTDQLATSGQNGSVSFVTTMPNASLGVSSIGTITTGGTLAPGTYTVSGTDNDAYGDTGTWTYSLTVQ